MIFLYVNVYTSYQYIMMLQLLQESDLLVLLLYGYCYGIVHGAFKFVYLSEGKMSSE